MNIVDLEFGSVPQGLIILHNNQVVNHDCNSNSIRLELDTQAQNTLTLFNSGPETVHVQHVTMFDLGRDKLVYLGQCQDQDRIYQSQCIPPGVRWQLTYDYPVFSWLHQVLDFGWLVAPDRD
jgi:hypothetical protein